MNTIDLLKDNKTAWKWVTPAQKSELLAAKKHGSMVFMDKNGYWQKHNGQESMGVVYRIAKWYKEKAKRPDIPDGMSCSKHSESTDVELDIYDLVLGLNMTHNCLQYIYKWMDEVATGNMELIEKISELKGLMEDLEGKL
jgi:hypothetical protein